MNSTRVGEDVEHESTAGSDGVQFSVGEVKPMPRLRSSTDGGWLIKVTATEAAHVPNPASEGGRENAAEDAACTATRWRQSLEGNCET